MAKKGRRGNQEGSIYQRADGRWVAQITYQGPDGKTKLVPKYFHTAGEARRSLTATKSKQDAHRLVISGKATVREWLDVWLEEFVKPNRAPSTYCSYYDVLKLHLPDGIGSLPLAKLAPETLQRHFNAIAAGGHGRTGELLRAVLRSAFNRAVKLRRMECNPVVGTDAVQYTQEEASTWTPAQGKQFLDAAADDRLGALATIALSLGLRKGEACGLRPDDVDLEARILHVRRSISWVKGPEDENGRWVVRQPKRGSIRDLPITETICRAVAHHIARRGEEALAAGDKWKDSGYLFVSPTGAPLHGSNVTEAFHQMCDNAGVPRIRFHDTRHTCGTLLHVQGADVFVIKQVLGHSQLATTKRYTHVPVEVTGQALEGLESLFEKAAKKQGPASITVKTTVKSDGSQIQ